MALGKPYPNPTNQFNATYQITLDMSGWDKTTVQVVGPVLGRIDFLATDDGGGELHSSLDQASLAINFHTIQATNLSTGTAVSSVYGPGLFQVPINAQYLRLQGTPAAAGTNVYRLLLFHSKIS